MNQVIDDIATYLQAQGLGTLGTNLFEANLPPNPDAAIGVIETGGLKPDIYLPLGAPSFQILVRSTEYDLGRAKCDLVRSALHNKYNVQFVVGGVYFYWCRLITEGGSIGQDKTGRDLFSMNFECLTR